MAKIYYGCDEVTKGWSRYFDLCTLLEVPHGAKPPSVKTLNTWRVDSPKGFCFAIHVTDVFIAELVKAGDSGASTLTEAMREAWNETIERASALAAKAIIFHTPFGFNPSDNTRALIRAIGDELATDAKQVVIWESEGVWPVEESMQLCIDHGLTYMVDPFLLREDDVEPIGPDRAYSITERGGMRRSFDQFDFEDLVDSTTSANRVFALLRGQYKWRHARELQQVLKEG